MKCSSSKIESFAINYINTLCEHNLLSSNICINDKTPSIDGTITIYKNDKFR